MGAPIPASLRPKHPPEWTITCPLDYCQARPGQPCRSRTTGRTVGGGSHPSRLDAWLRRKHAA